jgi:hypothetical protein
MDSLADRVAVLRDEVLDTAAHGEQSPPGVEVFDAIVRALAFRSESVPGLDLNLHDAAARRLAWGDTEETVLADAESVYDRLNLAVERSIRDIDEQLAIVEVATQVAASVARVVAMYAVQRGGRDRAARLREEMSHKQLRETLEKQQAGIERMEAQLAARNGRGP